MRISPKRRAEIDKEQKATAKLYAQGFSVREVAEKTTRSRTWVWFAIKKFGKIRK